MNSHPTSHPQQWNTLNKRVTAGTQSLQVILFKCRATTLAHPTDNIPQDNMSGKACATITSESPRRSMDLAAEGKTFFTYWAGQLNREQYTLGLHPPHGTSLLPRAFASFTGVHPTRKISSDSRQWLLTHSSVVRHTRASRCKSKIAGDCRRRQVFQVRSDRGKVSELLACHTCALLLE